VSEHRAEYPVRTQCRLLGVSPSGYYAWTSRPPSARSRRDDAHRTRIRAIHEDSRETYGSPRIHAELADEGIRTSRKRVQRLMRELGIEGASRRRKYRSRRGVKETAPAPDLVRRDFAVSAPDQLWVADITYVPTWSGFLYLSVVMDAFSRRIVGWSMATHLKTDLVLRALNMALWQRRPGEVIHHSDQGCQYTSIAFGLRCKEAGVRPSMGSAGDCYDNAMCESFFATLECELLQKRRFKRQGEARLAVFDFIEAWYNPKRRHSALGQLSPVSFEALHRQAGEAA
jgi:putative transposase